MNEHGFIRAVHRKLPTAIYRWKINDNYEGGVADAYYSSNGGDLWIEYKYIPALPKRDSTPVRTSLSAKQKLWLDQRYAEGRHVAVIIGSPEGNVVLTRPDQWREELTRGDFIRIAIDKAGLVAYIVSNTTVTS